MVPSEVSLATLLHDVGEMALWAFQPDKAAEIEDLIHHEKDLSRDSAQTQVLGFSCAALSAALASEWRLPLLVHESLKPENSSRPRIKIILLALQIARLAEQGWYSTNVENAIEEVAGVLRLSRSEMTSIVHRAAVNAARAYRTFAVLPAAAGLITLPAAAPGSSGARPAAAVPASPAPRLQQAGPAPKPEIFRQSLERLEQITDSQSTVPAIVKQALRGIHEGIGLHRAVYASCTPDGSSLKARVVRSCEQVTGFGQFRLELYPSHLFTRMMEKPMSIWVNDTNRSKLRELLPSSLLELLDCDTFFASSIFIDDRPEGLFYCDCHRASELLDEDRYQKFRQLCSSAADAMERLALAHSRTT